MGGALRKPPKAERYEQCAPAPTSVEALSPGLTTALSPQKEQSIEGSSGRRVRRVVEVEREEGASLEQLSSEEDGDGDAGVGGGVAGSEGKSEASFQSSLSDDEANANRDAMQRRLVYIDVPVGPSGALMKRVFEIREHSVQLCPLSRAVILSKPVLSHATTNMLIVRWEFSSLIEGKNIVQQELQVRQPDLDDTDERQYFSATVHDVPDPKDSSKPLEIFCTREFCTVPKAAVKILDARGELTIENIPGGCKPLLFRVRAEIAEEVSKYGGKRSKSPGGWGPWSEVSDPVQTLSGHCPCLTPRIVVRTAHSFKVSWTAPDEAMYGKVLRYELVGRRIMKNHKCSDWQVLYDGPNPSFCVGSVPTSAFVSQSIEALEQTIGKGMSVETISTVHSTVRPYNQVETDKEDAALSVAAVPSLTGEAGTELQPGMKYEVKVTATCGAWFNGDFHMNVASGSATICTTLEPYPDFPAAPFAKPYHGTVTATSVDLSWKAPLTYGNGHPVETYKRAVARAKTSSRTENKADTKHKRSSKLLRRGSSLRILPSHSARDVTGIDKSDEVSQEDNGEWEQQVDLEGGYSYWLNNRTKEVRYDKPVSPGIPIHNYILMAVFGDETTPVVVYKGPKTHYTFAGLSQETLYKFYLIVETSTHTSPPSKAFAVETLAMKVKRSNIRVPPFPELPLGWVECWDPVTEYCYYVNEGEEKSQWLHPLGDRLDDPALQFRQKRFKFRFKMLERLPTLPSHDCVRIEVKRTKVLQSSYEQLKSLSVDKLRKRINITFEGEDGIDSGGLSNEWYLQLSKAFFAETTSILRKHDSGLYCFVSASQMGSANRDMVRFMGTIVGKALYDNRVLDMPLCDVIYRRLLGQPPLIEDLAQIDSQFCSSLVWMLENNITDIIFETFSIVDEGENEVELVEGGKAMDVTEENKAAYVDAVVQWHLSRRYKEQFRLFEEGFFGLVEPEEIKEFTVVELRTLLNGTGEIKVKALKQTTKYSNGYSVRSKPVEYFWDYFEQLKEEGKSQLLAFITGCTKMPLEGLTLNIVKAEANDDALPSAHTCFNQLILPEYLTRNQLQEKLVLALENSEGFYMS